MKRVIVLGLALAAWGCGSEFSAQGSGGNGQITLGATGAAEVKLNPPRSDVPNLGTRTFCSAGTTGVYTYFLGKPTEDRAVSSAMVPSGDGFAISCQVIETQDATFVTARISGRDSNSRRALAALEFSGSIPRRYTFGALDSGAVDSEDTGPLASDPGIASCVLEDLTVDGARGFAAKILCPAVVGDDGVSGCEVTGSVSFAGCSG